MTQEIGHPLANIVARMAKKEVRGPAEKMKARYGNGSGAVVVLADVSGSMESLVGHSGMSKYQHMQIALADVEQGFPKLIIIAFASAVKAVAKSKDLPGTSALGGGTDLARALLAAAELKPSKTIIISDGEPDNARTAVEAVDKVTGVIDTIYCGPDNHPAVQFLSSLARQGAGTHVTWDGRHEISGVIRALLPAPAGV